MDTRAMIAAVFTIALFFALVIFALSWGNAQSGYRAALAAQKDLIVNFTNVIANHLETYNVPALTNAAEVFIARPDIVALEIFGRYDDRLIENSHRSAPSNIDTAVFTIPVAEEGTTLGRVVVHANTVGIKPMLWASLQIALLAFLLCILVGNLVIFYYIRRFVSRPLRDLQEACEATVSTGEHHVARFISDDRFGRYARSFNKMQEMLSKLTRQKSDLVEEMVEEQRTLETFLTAGRSSIVVYDQNGSLLFKRGNLIDEVFPEIDPRRTDMLARHWAYLEQKGKGISNDAGEVQYLVELTTPSSARVSRSLSFSFHQIDDLLTALFAFDITALRQAEMEVFQLQKTKALGELTSGAAHDFNNVLFAISANLEALLESRDVTPLDDRRRQLVGHCLDACQIGADLTLKLLSYSRRRVLNKVPIQVEVAIPEICAFLGRTVGIRYPIDVKVHTRNWISADSTMLQSALMNLVLNARNAMPTGGRIEVSVTDGADNQVAISVFNRGPPIPEDIIGRIFDPFVSTRLDAGGSGLGLSMVEGFVRQSGGSCEIRNIRNGVEAIMTFPSMSRNNIPSKAPEGENTQVRRGNGCLNILIVDDNEAVLGAMKMLFAGLGHRVTARLGSEGLLDELDLFVGFDVVLLDVMMPGTDGITLAKAVRNTGIMTPIILLTGLIDQDVEQITAEIPICERLSKPASIKTLIQVLDRLL